MQYAHRYTRPGHWILDETQNAYMVATECPICHRIFRHLLPKDGYEAWREGTHIQDALPNTSEDVREMLQSGVCPPCWEKIFAAEEEEGVDPYAGL